MNKRFVSMVDRFRRNLNKIEDLITILITIALVIIVFLQVFFRYFLNNPLAWSEEFARFTFIWLVYISSAVVLRDDSHMSMNFVVMRMPEKLRSIVDIVNKIMISVFLVLCIIRSQMLVAITMEQISPSLSIPMGFIYLALPVSFTLMLLDFVTRIILKKREGDK